MSTTEIFWVYFLAGVIVCSVWAVIYPYIPKVKIFSLELFPSIRIHVRTTIIHIHHWFWYPIILIVSFIVDGGVLASIPVRGYLFGSITKEILFPPKKNIVPRKIVYRKAEVR